MFRVRKCDIGELNLQFQNLQWIIFVCVLILCFCGVIVSESTLETDILNKNRNLEEFSHEQFGSRTNELTTSERLRFNKNLQSDSPYRGTRDTRTLRHILQEEYRRKNVKPPYLRKRIPSTSPWSSLYNQELRSSHTTSVNINIPQAHPPHTPDPFKTSNVKRIHPSSPMVTVLKTGGPSSFQDVQSKDFYRSVYGTQEGLKDLRGRYGPGNLTQAKVNYGVDQELEDVGLANEHFLRMRKIGRCHMPMAEVVCVKDLYPSDTKEYLPRCTILHRCGEKSGCCESEKFKCVPKAIQEVSLNFYAILHSSRTSEASVSDSAEKLLFENHTECECNPMEDASTDITEAQTTTMPTTITTSSVMPTTEEDLLDQQPQKDHSHSSSSHHEKCRECPNPFCRREYPDGRCSCDCFDKQKPCLKIKRGREAMIEIERRCVETHRCHIPDCDFGKFDIPTGRCPKKPDNLQKYNNKNEQGKNEYHRWNSYERD